MVVRLKRRTGDEEEGRSLVRGYNGSVKQDSSIRSGGSAFWKSTTLMLLVLLVLIVTETIEVKKPSRGGRQHGVQPSNEGSLELKPAATLPPVSEPNSESNANTDSEANQISVDTPKEVEPTEPPTQLTNSPTFAPVPDPSNPPSEFTKPTDSPTEAPKLTDQPTVASHNEKQPDQIAQSVVVDLASARTTERHTYRRRGQPMSDEEKKTMIEKWGQWTLVDDKDRPTTDYYAVFPNRDIPRSSFPSNAWQIDKDYLAKFLPEAITLVDRALEAILTEYGKTEGPFEERAEMFELEMYETLESSGGYIIQKPEWRKDENGERGGWSTYKSIDGLRRRLVHAVMTEDTFIFAMGGHSAAAGHGNMFVQSYTTQVQWILEAVFARLGVKHTARNMANGGLGTIQHGLAASSVYGPSVDLLMWDASMTEKDAAALEVFARQGIMGGTKVPVLWGFLSGSAKQLSKDFDADVGTAGRGTFGVATAETLEDLEAMPWAARYLKCGSDVNAICSDNKYVGHCWDDIIHPDVEPPTKQDSVPGGRAKWHPGSRTHQLQGRVLAFTILRSLKEGLKEWHEADNYDISDDKWHVTAWYDNIRSKLDPEIGSCKNLVEFDLDWTCKYPVKARTEFTPRAYPSLSNIRTLMPPGMKEMVPKPDRPLYDPPEKFISDLHPPAGAIDVLNIVEAGVDFQSTLNPDYAEDYYKKPTFASPSKLSYGKGIGLSTQAGDDYCDGTAESFCNKGPSSKCLLAGTNDGRNGLFSDGYSGWTVMNIPDLKHGYIALKFETWHKKGENPQTKDWTSENNESGTMERLLQNDAELQWCDAFKFEYAIDGEVTSMAEAEFVVKKHSVQRVVETITILEDPNYTGGEEKEVEVAFRMTGCGAEPLFLLSHIYWA